MRKKVAVFTGLQKVYTDDCLFFKRTRKKLDVEDSKTKKVMYFSYFEILNSKRELIEIYDYVSLDNVRLDMTGKLVRVYPKFGYTKVCYDIYTHMIYSLK